MEKKQEIVVLALLFLGVKFGLIDVGHMSFMHHIKSELYDLFFFKEKKRKKREGSTAKHRPYKTILVVPSSEP